MSLFLKMMGQAVKASGAGLPEWQFERNGLSTYVRSYWPKGSPHYKVFSEFADHIESVVHDDRTMREMLTQFKAQQPAGYAKYLEDRKTLGLDDIPYVIP